eukprot:SAG31_NODE_2171_length_6265_cov_3.765326_2_plen_362_part_00
MESCCPRPPSPGAAAGAGAATPPSCELPSECDKTDCADEYLRFFNDCAPQLARFPPEQLQPLRGFNAACEAYAGGASVRDAAVLSADALAPPPCDDARDNCAGLVEYLSCEADLCPSCPLAHQCDLTCDLCDGGQDGGSSPLLLCFDVTCRAPSLQDEGVIISDGCESGGALGTSCRLGCSTGYDEGELSDGTCTAHWLAGEEMAVGMYTGQSATCTPARNPDGTLSASFCSMQLNEILLDCCEMIEGGGDSGTPCGRESPPTACSLGCAERWLPLVEDCESHLADFQQLTAACEDEASALVGEAPSTVAVLGISFHVDANGLYSIAARTIGGKPIWVKAAGSPTESDWYLYWVNEPHDGW